MADDREILREIWDGRIPVCFTLAEEEVSTVDLPESFYLLVPRQSYFPLVTEKLQRHLLKWVKEESQREMWLEYDSQPLKWHYPIGVLFDLYGADSTLPWNITVHFQDFPEDELLHCPSLKAVESHFMSVLKESDTLKHRGQVINNMQKKDHKQLWMGLQNDKFEQFWSVNKKLMDLTSEDSFKYIPFRIYQLEKPIIQKLFSPTDEMGNTLTLGDLLVSAIGNNYTKDFKAENRIVIHGIEPPLQTPILWLSQHFSCPDNFLHICIVSISKDTI